jgi:hypothetical protein
MTTPLRSPSTRSQARRFHLLAGLWLAVLLVCTAWPASASAAPPAVETDCTDGVDNDGDLVFDCGDADCKDDPACQPDGRPENTAERCSDWVDNDGDGYIDCEDEDCAGTSACMGSWDREVAGEPGPSGSGSGATGTGAAPAGTIDTSGKTDEELLAELEDAGGERDNVTCSDGIDNDGDGLIDCEDLGCRLDSQVTVCQPSGNFRFSVVARIAQAYNLQENQHDTSFESLQLRMLGQMPFIQNSFFLITARAERTPRVVFAMFQVPLGKKGHYVNINSGGGGLSLELVRSVHKRLLADPAFYVYNAFEQGNGAAVEFGGPMDKKNRFLYRTFVAGGSGRFAGNIGGTFFPGDNRNYTWALGLQFWMNLVGYYNRWDNPFLYTKSPLAVALAVGGKFDQRAEERYPGMNAQFIARYWRFHVQAESYTKRELVFRNWQTAYNVQLGFLPWQRRIMLAADFGQYLATDFEDPPANIIPGTDLARQIAELQYRAAMHVYLWRDVFFATLVWRDRRLEPPPGETGIQVAQDVRLMATYRW